MNKQDGIHELHWQVDCTLYTDPTTEKGIAVIHISTVPGNLSSILNITALPMNDNIGISCQMIKHSTLELKETAVY